jgi:hypothetical protein
MNIASQEGLLFHGEISFMKIPSFVCIYQCHFNKDAIFINKTLLTCYLTIKEKYRIDAYFFNNIIKKSEMTDIPQ